jgi:subtilisin family serine protease
MSFVILGAITNFPARERREAAMEQRKLFAKIGIALLLIGLVSALPLTSTRVVVSMGDVEAMPIPSDLEALSAYPPGRTFRDFVDGYVAFDQDMIDTDRIVHTHGRWYGRGVVVAVLDTGLLPNWNYFFPRNRILTELAIGFAENLDTGEITTVPWDDALNGHGTHVTSTIIGYNYRGTAVIGVAPLAKIIPVKVLSFYDYSRQSAWGTSGMVSAGIDYVTSLVGSGMFECGKVIINMSLGSSVPAPDIEAAINRAINAGVIIVASAGNRGNSGMGWPGAYPQVISAGWAGWTGQWFPITGGRENRDFWLGDVPEDLMMPAATSTNFGTYSGTQVYVAAGSSRELAGQDLDVVAPGSWVVGPYWTPAWGSLPSDPSTCYGYLSGTSMASPHVAGTAALLAEKRGTKFTQSEMEFLIESTASSAPLMHANSAGWVGATLPFMAIYVNVGPTGYYWTQWGNNAVGEGFLQTDAAVAALGS